MNRIYGNTVAFDGGEIGVDVKVDCGEINMTEISDKEIGVFSGTGGTYLHDKLKNRDLKDQHPIEAITGLREELDSKLGSFSVIFCGTSTEVIT